MGREGRRREKRVRRDVRCGLGFEDGGLGGRWLDGAETSTKERDAVRIDEGCEVAGARGVCRLDRGCIDKEDTESVRELKHGVILGLCELYDMWRPEGGIEV